MKTKRRELGSNTVPPTPKDFPAVEGEVESLREELTVLELFSQVHGGDEQCYIKAKTFQIAQLEEELEVL